MTGSLVNRFTERKRTDFIVVHCSATDDDMDIGAEDIRRWHRQRGWVDIGYHKVIRRDGTVEPGRPLHALGAHVRGHNHHSVGVCMVGGVDANRKHKAVNNFTPEQFASLRKVIENLQAMYPEAKVVGHRDLDPHKACPSFDVKEWLNENFS